MTNTSVRCAASLASHCAAVTGWQSATGTCVLQRAAAGDRERPAADVPADDEHRAGAMVQRQPAQRGKLSCASCRTSQACQWRSPRSVCLQRGENLPPWLAFNTRCALGACGWGGGGPFILRAAHHHRAFDCPAQLQPSLTGRCAACSTTVQASDVAQPDVLPGGACAAQCGQLADHRHGRLVSRLPELHLHGVHAAQLAPPVAGVLPGQ